MKKKKRGQPLKGADEGLKEYLELRLSTKEKEGFRMAADSAGMALSVWIRSRLREIARFELEEHGFKAPFVMDSAGQEC